MNKQEQKQPKQPKLMPAGKMQFGIIVPIETHKHAKHLAADMGWRISDVYSEGVKAILDAKNANRGPEEVALIREVTKGIDKEQWGLFRALAAFLRDKPRSDQMDMLKLILGKYLPAENHNRKLARVNG